MRIPIIVMALLALCPAGALAQGTDFKGLDLSGDEPKAEEAEKPAARSYTPPAATAAAPVKENRLDEVAIANEDRVKSVQRKAFLKKYRAELTPMGFLTLNDAFYKKMGPGARASFFFSDNLGMALRYNQYNVSTADDIRIAKRELRSKLPKVNPEHGFALDLLWSPFYGKVAVGNGIHTFDLYLIAGADGLYTQTSDQDGMHLGTHLGIGQRFSLTDWVAVDLSLLETMYSDRPDAMNKAVLQHMVSVNLGLSVFLPFGFEYKEP